MWFFSHHCLGCLHNKSHVGLPERWPWGHWGGECVCLILAPSFLALPILGAVCDAGGNLKPFVAWGYFGGSFPLLGSAMRSAGDSLVLRLGSGSSAAWPACLHVVFLREFYRGWWRCARVDLVLLHFEGLSLLLKGTLVSIWPNAVLSSPFSTHAVASLWKLKKKIEHCLLQLGFYRVPLGIKHAIPSGSF